MLFRYHYQFFSFGEKIPILDLFTNSKQRYISSFILDISSKEKNPKLLSLMILEAILKHPDGFNLPGHCPPLLYSQIRTSDLIG